MHLRLLLLATTTTALLPPQHAKHRHTTAYLTPVEKALASGDAESVVTALEDTTTDLSRTLAAACLDRACAVAAAPDGSGAAAAPRSEEDRLARCYEALRAHGLASPPLRHARKLQRKLRIQFQARQGVDMASSSR